MSADEQQPEKAPEISGAQIEFAPDQIIFNQGDPGGDLYFVKQGHIEVFQQVGSLSVPLAVLGPGEVLGIMTCLTREPRMASARAVDEVRVVAVKQAGIKTLISSTPPWVNTVIKDFSRRIIQMDELYGRSIRRIDELSKADSVMNRVAYVAATIAELAPLKSDLQGLVEVDELLGSAAAIVGISLEDMRKSYDRILESGILKAKTQDLYGTAEAKVMQRLGEVAQLIRSRMQGEQMPEGPRREVLMLAKHMGEFIKKSGGATGDPQKVSVGKLAQRLEAEITDEDIAELQKYGGVKVEGDNEKDRSLVYTPTALVRTARIWAFVYKLEQEHQETVNQFTKIENPRPGAEPPNPLD